MKLLLTSAGIRNATIRAALDELLPCPVSQAHALCVPTASYAHSGGMRGARRFIAGESPQIPMTDLGWASVGVLEPSVLPSLPTDLWTSQVREADVLLVNGGDPMFLCHWMRESGLSAQLADLPDTVWVGFSAGSMVLTPRIGHDFVGWSPPDGGDETLGVVDFSIFPHLDHPDLPENTLAEATRWAESLDVPAYAIDDETAIVVDGDRVEVVSEGHWRHFPA